MQINGIIHTQADAINALKLIAKRHGRAVDLNIVHDGGAESRLQDEWAVKLCDILIDLLASAFGVPSSELRALTRSRREIARIRQIGIYIAHTTFKMPMRTVAIGFSRDRSTVMYACHQIEDMRDDCDFDAIVGAFERVVETAFTAKRIAA